MYSGISLRILSLAMCVPLLFLSEIDALSPSAYIYIVGSFYLFSLPLFFLDTLSGFFKPFFSKRTGQGLTFLFSITPLLFASTLALQLSFFSGLAAILGLLIIFALFSFFLFRHRGTKDFYFGAAFASLGLCAIHIFTHHLSGTLSTVKAAGEWLHLILFIGTWLLSVALIPLFATQIVYTHAGGKRANIGWLTSLLSTLGALILGIFILVVDQNLYVGLYAYLHYWLIFIGLGALQAFLTPILHRVLKPKATTLYLIGALASLLVVGTLSWTLLTPKKSDIVFRVGLDNSTRSAFPLSLAKVKKPKGYEKKDLSALAFQRYENVKNDTKKQNIILLSIDTLRGDYVGKDEVYSKHTPRLSALAEESLSFESAYAPGNRTAIGMGSFLLGRYSAEIDWELWYWWNGKVLNPRKFKKGKKKRKNFGHTTIPKFPKGGTLAQRIQNAGYHTIGIPFTSAGSFFSPGIGFEKGFDVYQIPKISRKTPTSGKVLNLALKALEKAEQQDKPTFLWVHLFDPHQSGAKKEKYDLLVEQCDQAIGAFFDVLKKRGQWETTSIIVISDHGEARGEHRIKHHGASLYNEETRVPFIVRVPGKAPLKIPAAASTIDGAITAVALAGGKTEGMSGVNLLPVLDGKPYPENRPIFTEMHRYRGPTGRHSHDGKAVIYKGWKLIYNRRRGWMKLFHLTTDPLEKENLLGKRPQKANTLLTILLSFIHPLERLHPLPDINAPPIET